MLPAAAARVEAIREIDESFIVTTSSECFCLETGSKCYKIETKYIE